MTRAQRLCGIAAACLALTAGAAMARAASDAASPSLGQATATSAILSASQPALRPSSLGAASPDAARQRPDADGDGRISKAEFVQARLRPLLAMDADGDGTISVAERTTWREARINARATQRFEQMDADGDGMVTRSEFDAAGQKARSQRGERRAARASAPSASGEQGAGSRRYRGDRSSGRAAQSAPLAIAEARTRVEATFSRLDQDADGFISRTERQALRGEARQRSGAGYEGRSMRRQGRLQADPTPTPASPVAPASE